MSSVNINHHELGALVRVSAIFKDSDGDAADPDVVKCSIRNPAGTVTTYVYNTDVELVRDSLGNFHLDVSTTAKGTWYYRWFSTGDGQAANESQFIVDPALAV